MLGKLKQKLTRSKCYYCKQHAPPMTPYMTASRESVHVCFKCVPYAERRGLLKP
ncbi:hypothetical protein [Salsuginibacillus halophilus]|uniref:hypothetical protein n=1 Tax=Salsuginibacillus halophilus TaxID=517424 RepID=UPI0015E7D3A5|nr:hypothetical protein [Salsuginibacillus halophilus]